MTSLDAVLDRLTALPEPARVAYLSALTTEELAVVTDALDRRTGNRWARYLDDPIGFVQEGMGETLWSAQREILLSIRDNHRTVVPACHAPGKTHLAARAATWWISVHPPGTAQVVTTATTFRQVRNLLWPQIRRLHARHDLPGETSQVEWRIGTDIVAYGFSAPDWDDASVQGIHAPHLLIVVDEAGGIHPKLGQALEALMTGGHTRMLLIGNPPVDLEDTWFEQKCSSPLYNVIRIPAEATPNFTGEPVDECKSCPPEVAAHSVAEHLVDQRWVDDVTTEFGEDSAFVQARVHARFPRSAPNKVIPLDWVEAACENEHPVDGPGWVRYGVDVAADGGDEFVIARAEGMRCTIVHASSGSVNRNAVDVAAKVLEFIVREEETAHPRRLPKVKIDVIGLGWGVVSTLQKWRDEGKFRSAIVPVNVSHRAGASSKFANQRAEMWWNGRTLLQPTDEGQQVRLDVDRRTATQLSGPLYGADSTGRITIESKQVMRRRGVTSPDRAEAVLLALYDPPNETDLGVSPVVLGQENPWDLI